MDIVIVSTSNVQQEELWQKRLTQIQPKLLASPVHILCISEDWTGGAGNGLGTLYAYLKASRKAKALFNLDIGKAIENGASISLYHTAGEGRRLYPLTGSELGNKSAVKLPGFIPGSKELISILEAVIYQTSSLAQYRKGRLSVYWGDQIFLPSTPCRSSQHHIEIVTKNRPLPSVDEWKTNGYARYGFVVGQQGLPNFIFEKLSEEKFSSVLKTHAITSESEFGLSLGCFSLSHEILQAFLNLFKDELSRKEGKFDTDVHFWMPLILDEKTYLGYMLEKKFTEPWAARHYQRLQSFKQQFCGKSNEALFGTWDIGTKGLWLDYGSLPAYFSNNREILQKNEIGEALRQFFGWECAQDSSFQYNSTIASGTVKNSILINVEAHHLDVSDCLIIDSKFNSLKASQCLLYQVSEEAPLSLREREVRADVQFKDQQIKLYSSLDRDAKNDWNTLLPKNKLSYCELNQLWHETCAY